MSMYYTNYLKQFLSVVVMIMVTTCLCAKPHKPFQGIPINGTISSFRVKMEQKGFQYKGCDRYSYNFQGIYLGKVRNVGVYTNSAGIVYKVKIVLPNYNFSALLRGYIDLYDERPDREWYEWDGPEESYSFISEEGMVNLWRDSGITYLEFVDSQNDERE